MKPLRVLILGGGYAGLACLRTLSPWIHRGTYSVQLLDAAPYHSIKTRFHELAVLENRQWLLRQPLAAIARSGGAEFVCDRVEAVEYSRGRVLGRSGEYPFDRLLLAVGGRIAHFGVPGAAEHTVSLQTFDDALHCSRRLSALRSGRGRRSLCRIVVCGAGVEGLEVAAMVRTRFPPGECAVTVVERSETLMARSQCGEAQRNYLLSYLERHRIELRLGANIAAVTGDAVELEGGTLLPADLVYWCAGVRRVELQGLSAGEPCNANRYLQLRDHPEIFVAGDVATVDDSGEFSNLASAQRAVYHGTLAAKNLWRFDHLRLLRPAEYRPIGELIGLGDFDGIGVLYGLPVRGIPASALKKANEVKYLSELYQNFPSSYLRRLRATPPVPVDYPRGSSDG